MSTTAETLLTRPSEVMRGQIAKGLGIPRSLYVDEELYKREVATIFGTSWMLVGHESQLQEDGQYITVDCGDESLVVVRTATGLAAFQNVCRHRGSRVVDTGCGKVRAFVCPYHQWSYGVDGALMSAPNMPPGFDPAAYGLKAASVDVWQGLVFANVSPDVPATASDLLSASDSLIGPFDIASARIAHTITYDVAANWKLVWENAQECYHCAANHPEFMKTFLLAPLNDDAWRTREVRVNEDHRVQFSKLPLQEGAVSLTIDGRQASRQLMGDFDRGTAPYTAAVHLKPTFAMICCPDYAVLLSERPVAVDRSAVTMSWLVRGDAEEGRDFDLERLIEVWDQTNRQDWELCERTQLGVRSQYFEPGPLSGDEPSVATFHQAYAQMLELAGL